MAVDTVEVKVNVPQRHLQTHAYHDTISSHSDLEFT